MIGEGGSGSRMLTREDFAERDRNDPLGPFRARFPLPEGVIYLDGNSLGPPSLSTFRRVERLIEEEWRKDLIGSWNNHGWFQLPERVGASIAPLLGARKDEVIAADSVSLNLFKLLAALLRRPGPRTVVLAEESDFPTDLYIAEGLASLLGERGAKLRLVARGELETAFAPDVAVALLTQVDFRTGRKRDLHRVTAIAKDAGVPVVLSLIHI